MVGFENHLNYFHADGGGLNVWRQVTRMEAILQALTYPDIGTIMFTDAQWDVDPTVALRPARSEAPGRRLRRPARSPRR